MSGVPLDGLGELLPQSSGFGLRRISRSHKGAPLLDRVRCFEDQENGWARRHEIGQATEKRPLPVNRVEPFSLSLREANLPHRANSKSR